MPPVELSGLGLVWRLTQTEHVCLTWGLGGGKPVLANGDDEQAGGSAKTVDKDLSPYPAEVETADLAIAAIDALEDPGRGLGRPLGATLIKMLDEYALHSGQAHMLCFAALGEMIH